jgi:glycosyltransferase involved in cell wall biosynthesis
MCESLAAQGFARLNVLARGVDTRLFNPTRRDPKLRHSWGVSTDAPVVIYVGRLAAEKNLSLAVEAFLEFRKSVPEAHFVLVGDGPEKAGLAAKYPNFTYAGVRRGEDLAAHYASADVFVFPSTTETFGNVVTEALASGLVVATYDYAAGRQNIVHGENGFLATFGEAQRFLGMMSEIVAKRAAWPRIAKAGRLQAEGLTWEAIVSRFESELQRAIPPSQFTEV